MMVVVTMLIVMMKVLGMMSVMTMVVVRLMMVIPYMRGNNNDSRNNTSKVFNMTLLANTADEGV